ncbi:flagellar filament capping protein FliD [Roseomonas aeriglobus]|nr:flagellar filament capping protein FliD [Roseomonas aeriglobus]
MVDSIAKTLGSGSGIDVTALVTSLVAAQFSTKTKQIESRTETLTAQVSAVSELKSGMTQFATALSSLVKGGTLASQATSSNTSIVKASVISGKQVSDLSATVEVKSLASAQVAATGVLTAGKELGVDTDSGKSGISIQFYAPDANGVLQPSARTIDISFDSAAETTPSAIAAKINATPNAGLTASVISDRDGDRLVLKSATGIDQTFSIAATGSSDFVAAMQVTRGDAKIMTTAADAKLLVDGVPVSRSSNSISDLVPGIKLDLQSAVEGTKVTLGSTPSTAALTQAVNDVVTTYNELYKMVQAATDPVSGKLSRDPAAQEMKRQLRSLTLTDLTGATDGSPKTLSELGVTTGRDGLLSVDSKRLTSVLASNPAAVEAMFTDRGVRSTKDGLSAALNAVSSTVTSFAFGLGAAQTRYSKAQSALTEEKTKLTAAQEKATARLTQQYSTMDSRVAAYKATQSMLDNQIAAWNKS